MSLRGSGPQWLRPQAGPPWASRPRHAARRPATARLLYARRWMPRRRRLPLRPIPVRAAGEAGGRQAVAGRLGFLARPGRRGAWPGAQVWDVTQTTSRCDQGAEPWNGASVTHVSISMRGAPAGGRTTVATIPHCTGCFSKELRDTAPPRAPRSRSWCTRRHI